MDKFKKKLNNSHSINKSLPRHPQPMIKSFFHEPRQFDNKSFAYDRDIQSNADAYIQQKRNRIESSNKFANTSNDLQTSLIEKTLKINKILTDVHNFSIYVSQLKWLLNQGDRLIHQHLQRQLLISPHTAHTQDIAHIGKQIHSLVLRFNRIQQGSLKNANFILKQRQAQCHYSVNQSPEDKDQKLGRILQQLSALRSHEMNKDNTKDNSLMETKNCTMNLKQNVNTSNFMNHFSNINLEQKNKQQFKKSNISQIVRQSQIKHLNTKKRIPTAQSNQQQMIDRIKQQFFQQIKQQNSKNEQLLYRIEQLRQEISGKDSKISKYKVTSLKSIQILGDILKKLIGQLSNSQRQLQHLRMAQCVANWQKMIQSDIEEEKYRQIYTQVDALALEKTQKLQQIIGLQYDINCLMDRKKNMKESLVEPTKNVKQNKKYNDTDTIFMLLTQAITIQQMGIK